MYGKPSQFGKGNVRKIFKCIKPKVMKTEFQDRIDDYLLNRMAEADRRVFESDVAHDAELKEQLEFTKEMRQIVKSRNEKLAAMKEWDKKYEWEHEEVASREYRATGSGYDNCSAPPIENRMKRRWFVNKRLVYWISGIAAVFVAGIFIVNAYWNKANYQECYTTSDPISKNTPVPTLGPTPINKGIRSGGDHAEIERLLEDKQYRVALCLIEKEERDIRIRSMGGGKLEYANESNEKELGVNTQSGDEEERLRYEQERIKIEEEEIHWLKVFALLGLERRDEALQLLDELRQADGEYQMQADSLYRIIIKQ